MWIFSKFLAIFFPPRCFLCRKAEVTLCNTCLSSKRRALDAPLPWVHSHFAYKDVSKIIHAIKYFRRRDLIHPLVVHSCTKELRDHIALLECPILVPIPMPFVRTWTRGYNQAELISSLYAQILNIPSQPLLRRRLASRHAILRSRLERLRAPKSMFLAQNDVQGRDIILVDDVVTTGATLIEARTLLQNRGARNILAITLAH